MIMGHEFSGEIVGDRQGGDRPLYVGQRVSGEGHIIDLNPPPRAPGQFHLDPGTKGVGVNRQGAFAEYLWLPAFNVVPLPDEVSDWMSAPCSIRSATPCTRRSNSN